MGLRQEQRRVSMRTQRYRDGVITLDTMSECERSERGARRVA